VKIGFIDIICDPARPGQSGLSDIVWDMARTFVPTDEVHVAAPYTVEPPAVPGITVHRFPIPPIGYRNIVGHGLLALRAWQRLRAVNDLDVVIAPEYFSTGLIAPFSRCPVVLVTPGNIFERIARGSNPFDWPTTQVYKVAAWSSARCCALIDAISEDMAEAWRRTGAPADRVLVIPHGVDIDQFRPVPDARARLGLDEALPIIVYVGRLSPEKRLDTLLGAMHRLRPEIPSIRLYLLGEGPRRPSLERLVRELGLEGRVVFAGQVAPAELPFWYSSADAVVLPSSSEPLGRVMLEAMACGAPFVGTRMTGMADIVDDGRNGFLVPSRDEAALADRLRLLLTDRSIGAALGRVGRQTILEGLTWPAVVGGLRAELLQRCTKPSVPVVAGSTAEGGTA
jgi:glycosyltransferase involved in cell wall biosynthesis